jgi:hypothetical protein
MSDVVAKFCLEVLGSPLCLRVSNFPQELLKLDPAQAVAEAVAEAAAAEARRANSHRHKFSACSTCTSEAHMHLTLVPS